MQITLDVDCEAVSELVSQQILEYLDMADELTKKDKKAFIRTLSHFIIPDEFEKRFGYPITEVQ